MISRTAAYANIVLLRYRILLRYNALPRLLVELDAPAKVLFGTQAECLTLVESQVRVYINLERSTESLVLLLNENCQPVATSLRCNIDFVYKLNFFNYFIIILQL